MLNQLALIGNGIAKPVIGIIDTFVQGHIAVVTHNNATKIKIKEIDTDLQKALKKIEGKTQERLAVIDYLGEALNKELDKEDLTPAEREKIINNITEKFFAILDKN